MPEEETTTAEAKPGFKTTEFWLTVAAMVLTFVFASGAVPEAGVVEKGLAVAATILGSLGYTVSRTLAKRAQG